jgi:hypothetical protein
LRVQIPSLTPTVRDYGISNLKLQTACNFVI